MGAIYKIYCNLTNKSYIGQTSGKVKSRWNSHINDVKRRDGCSALYSAIKKYGIDNFILSTIVELDCSKDELNLLEQKYINDLNTLSPNGYNLQTGGKSFKLSQEVKDKISKKMKGREIKWKDKIGKYQKEIWKDIEYREKMSKSHIGKRGKYKKHLKPLRLDLDIEKINKLYKQGFSINKISKICEVSFYTIKKRIGKN